MQTLRAAEPDDAVAMAALWVRAMDARLAEPCATAGPGGRGPTDAGRVLAAQRDVSQRLADHPAASAVVVSGGAVHAMAVAVQARADDGASPEHLPGLVHVSMVAVDPRQWGHGLGTAVVNEVLRSMTAHGLDRAQLWTQESNHRALSLYRRLGWVASVRTKVEDGETVCLLELPSISTALGPEHTRGQGAVARS